MLPRVLARCFATAAHGNNLVFLGAPGVGKGTFAGRIAKLLNVPAISTGDIMRAEIKAGSALGQRVKEYTSSGRLVPDEIVTAVVKERLSKPDAAKGYILVRRVACAGETRVRCCGAHMATPCAHR
jgi:nucleoside-triphosphatase THEP1